MNKFVLVIFFTSWQLVATAHILTSKDSIGITTRNNEKFIVHAVEAGETLYSLAHKYHVSTDDLARINPILKSDGLKAGSRIFVPLKRPPKFQYASANLRHYLPCGETQGDAIFHFTAIWCVIERYPPLEPLARQQYQYRAGTGDKENGGDSYD